MPRLKIAKKKAKFLLEPMQMKDQQDFAIGHIFEEEKNVTPRYDQKPNLWGAIYEAVQQWSVIKNDYRQKREMFIKYRMDKEMEKVEEEGINVSVEQ
jgi:hypothetical protein